MKRLLEKTLLIIIVLHKFILLYHLLLTFIVSLNFVTSQIAKLELETNNLNQDYAQQRNNIEAREAEMHEQESIAAKCREDFQSIKIERDRLQENRK